MRALLEAWLLVIIITSNSIVIVIVSVADGR